LSVVRGGRFAVGEVFGITLVSTAAALGFLMAFVLLRMICRRTWIAGTVLCVLWGLAQGLPLVGLWGPRGGLFSLLLFVVPSAVPVLLLVRLGLLALMAAFLLGGLSRLAVFTFDPSSPLFGTGLFVTAVAFAVAAYGFRTSTAGRPLIQDPRPRG
jgi:hypothetical protein